MRATGCVWVAVASAVLVVGTLGSLTAISISEGFTYKAAAAKCKAKGLTICPSTQLCANGTPVAKAQSKSKEEKW